MLKTYWYNSLEDAVPSPSQSQCHWVGSDYMWTLEVRDQMPQASWRMGEMKIRGTFDGDLSISIEPMEKV